MNVLRAMVPSLPWAGCDVGEKDPRGARKVGQKRESGESAGRREVPRDTASSPGLTRGHVADSRYRVAEVVSDTLKLALDLSRSAVKDQASRLSDLRTRAGTLLAAASIAGSFSGVTHGALDVVAAAALVAYVTSVAACIYVLMPHRLSTEFRGGVLLNAIREVEATDDEAHEAVVQWLENVRDNNAIKLDDLTRWYAAAAIALGVEVVLWIVALAT
jgi:hypothetical protein